MSWEVKPLGELCEVFTDGDWIESKDQSPEGIRLVQTGNIGEGVFKDREDKARFISKATFARLNCTEVFEGDCLVSRLPDPVGRACILPDTGKQMITGVDCSIIRFKHKVMKPEFFQYYSQSDLYLKDVAKLISGTTRDRISRKNLGTVPVPNPPLPEQERIVGKLDAAFAALAEAQAHVERNRANARELFESYLNGVFEGKGDGWVEKTIGECFRIRSGDFLPAKSMNESGPYEVYGGNGVAGKHDAYNLSGSNVVIGRVGAKCGNVRHIETPIWLTDNAFNISEFHEDFDHEFLTYLLNHLDLRSFARQAAQPVVSFSSLKDVVLRYPSSVAVQRKIAERMGELEAETEKLDTTYQQKLTELAGLKKAVLGAAFRGEL